MPSTTLSTAAPCSARSTRRTTAMLVAPAQPRLPADRCDKPYSGEEDAVTVMRSVIMDPWMAEDIDGRPFLDTSIAELRAVVIEEVEAYRATLAD